MTDPDAEKLRNHCVELLKCLKPDGTFNLERVARLVTTDNIADLRRIADRLDTEDKLRCSICGQMFSVNPLCLRCRDDKQIWI
jgi:hypothetical protein